MSNLITEKSLVKLEQRLNKLGFEFISERTNSVVSQRTIWSYKHIDNLCNLEIMYSSLESRIIYYDISSNQNDMFLKTNDSDLVMKYLTEKILNRK